MTNNTNGKGPGRKRLVPCFDAKQYYKWKEMGWSDLAIANEIGVSTYSVVASKKELGIPTRTIKRITKTAKPANVKKMVMFKLKNYDRIKTEPVLEVIESMENGYAELQVKYDKSIKEKFDVNERLKKFHNTHNNIVKKKDYTISKQAERIKELEKQLEEAGVNV